jgi:universal stress protein A
MTGPVSTFRLRKILVPIDFSDGSKKALQYAVGFARQFNAELTLLHVVEPFPPVPQMDPVDFDSIHDAKSKLNALQEAEGKRVACKAVLRTGEPHAEIIDAAKDLGVDLFILATRGRTGLPHLLLGRTAEKVVRHAGCPVLIDREHERDFIGSADIAKAASLGSSGVSCVNLVFNSGREQLDDLLLRGVPTEDEHGAHRRQTASVRQWSVVSLAIQQGLLSSGWEQCVDAPPSSCGRPAAPCGAGFACAKRRSL